MSPDADLVKELLPYMAKLNPDWEGVECDIEFEASKCHQQLIWNLKQKFKKNGKYLNIHLKKEKAQAQGATTISETNESARKRVNFDKGEEPTNENEESMQDLDQGEKVTQQLFQEVGATASPATPNPQVAAAQEILSPPPGIPKGLSNTDIFREMNLIASNIRFKKREIKMLHKAWQAYNARVMPLVKDPLEDSE